GDGARLTTRISGRRYATPLLVLIIAIAVTDLAFAFDSIPAIFGLTRDPYLVFTANVFALLGLRHLYFLIGGLLGRVPPLPAGLSAILGFLGVKLIPEALLESGVPQIGPVPVPHIGTGLSLAIIAAVITTVTLTSLLAAGRRSRPETFNLPDGSRRLRTQRGCAGVSGRRLLTSWGSRAGGNGIGGPAGIDVRVVQVERGPLRPDPRYRSEVVPRRRAGRRHSREPCALLHHRGASAPAASPAAGGPREASQVGARMRYLWRLGGDSRYVTSAAANAAVSSAAGRATAARPGSGQAEVDDDQAGRWGGGYGERCGGPVTRSAACWQPRSMISAQSGAAPRLPGWKPFM